MIQYMYHDMNIAFLQYLYENVFGHDENEYIKIAKTKWFFILCSLLTHCYSIGATILFYRMHEHYKKVNNLTNN